MIRSVIVVLMQVHSYPRLHRSQVSVAVHTMAFQVLLFAMPLSLFIPGCFFSIWNASLIFLSLVCLAWSRMVTSDHLISCGSSLLLSSTCSATADFSGWSNRIASLCSLQRTWSARMVSPTYSSSQVLHLIEYTTCVEWSVGSRSLTA